MEVRNQHTDYKDWKTLRQWNLLGKTPIDLTQCKEMWPNQNCCSSGKFFTYCSPENVRDMTQEEMLAFNLQTKLLTKKQQDLLKEEKDKEKKRIEDVMKLREVYNTEFQWQLNNRKLKPEAKGVSGSYLNGNKRADGKILYSSPFGNEYTYYHIDDTEIDENCPSVFDYYNI